MMTTKEKTVMRGLLVLSILFLVGVLVWNYYHGECHLEEGWDAVWCFFKEIG